MERKLIFLRLRKIFFLLVNFKYLIIFLKYNVAPSIEHKSILSSLRLDKVVDVGANNGQFSLLIQILFPKIKIIAFEPIKGCSDNYNSIFSSNKKVRCINAALGNKKSYMDFYVTLDDDSSSLMLPNKSTSISHGSDFKKKIKVDVILGNTSLSNAELTDSFLKIDVQGYELEVLRGLRNKITLIKYIFIELSHIELYKNQPLFTEVLDFLKKKNFILTSISNKTFSDKKLIQADYLFINKKYVSK